MSEPYNTKVDLSSETDIFTDLISLGLKTLIGGVMEKLDPAFRAMGSKNWADDAQVGLSSFLVLRRLINTAASLSH